MAEPAEGGATVAAAGEVQVRRALLTVSDKRGLVDFARGLQELGIEIVSTGGTAGELGGEGVETRSEHEIEPIDLVCVNLYPFERVANQRGVEPEEVLENIDIGGPTLIRAAAKNHAFSAVVVSPESYDAVLDELQTSDSRLSEQTREALAMDAFAYTARYDTAIARWFGEREEEFPSLYVRAYEKVLDLSYGENPHQRAAYYAQTGARTDLLSMVSKLHGKALSFNNLLDLDSGRKLVDDFEVPACAIVKHNNPCGCALGGGADEAFRKALECDPMSAFGGVVCFNRRVDRYTAEQVNELFVELIFAPGYDEDALEILQQKKNIRILDNQERRDWPISEHDIKRVRGGILIQHRDEDMELRDEMQVVTKRKPTEQEWGDLLFGWKAAKHVRSNAIVMVK